ncbi:MAG TPA: YtxH domain-containing protein [bacterium]|nr:YtxH domain-containing protein [bacterium]
MSERRDFAGGLLLGVLVGAALGVLFAPAAGNETRERLRREGEQLRDRAREQAERVTEQARRKADEVASRVRSTAGDVLERGRSVIEERAERLRDAYQAGRDSAFGREGGERRDDDAD